MLMKIKEKVNIPGTLNPSLASGRKPHLGDWSSTGSLLGLVVASPQLPKFAARSKMKV